MIREARLAFRVLGTPQRSVAKSLLSFLKPDHVRDVDFFARRYNIRAVGPKVFHRDDVPETELESIYPGLTLPGLLYDWRNNNETPLWLPKQRTIVFADALTAPDGELLVWSTPWHRRRVLPALRDSLNLSFERVIVSHGYPVHTRSGAEPIASGEREIRNVSTRQANESGQG